MTSPGHRRFTIAGAGMSQVQLSSRCRSSSSTAIEEPSGKPMRCVPEKVPERGATTSAAA